jgi:hypothetical protein
MTIETLITLNYVFIGFLVLVSIFGILVKCATTFWIGVLYGGFQYFIIDECLKNVQFLY